MLACWMTVALPETVKVKLSSEAAEAISITPVVLREMPTRELVEHMLGVTGKDPGRIHELLLRGTLVSGASRFRWNGWDAGVEDIQRLVRTFPDPEPGRAFVPALCVRAVLHGGRVRIEMPREVGMAGTLGTRLLHRRSFWDVLMGIAGECSASYRDYSYKARADQFAIEITPAAAARLSEAAGNLKYSTLREQIRATRLTSADLFVERG
jgi:hypothetical protein